MQTLKVGCRASGSGNNIDGTTGEVDDGRADDADVGVGVEIAIFIEIGQPGFVRIDQELTP